MKRFTLFTLILMSSTACAKGRLQDFCDRFPEICCPPSPVPTPTPTPSPSPSPVPTPTPTPSPTPSPETEPPPCPTIVSFNGTIPGTATKTEVVDAAVLFLIFKHPELFTERDGQVFLRDYPTDPLNPRGEQLYTNFYNLLRDALPRFGACAYFGVHDIKDEIQVLNANRDSEGYHLIFTGNGRVRKASDSFKGTADVTLIGPLCRLPPDSTRLRAKLSDRQLASRFLDATFEYFYPGIDDQPLGLCGRRWCDLGVDGGEDGRNCATTLIGVPQWSSTGSLLLRPGFNGNPYFAKVESGSGTARVCSETLPTSCGELVIQ